MQFWSVRRKLSLELLEPRRAMTILPGVMGTNGDTGLMGIEGFGGGERIQAADIDGIESLEPMPEKSKGGKVKGDPPLSLFEGANLRLDSGVISDGFGIAQSVLLVGQQILLRADWTATNLPNVSYTVGFYFDGVRLDSGSVSGNGNYFWYRAGSFASPGTHSFRIVLDPDNLISEINEQDNTVSFDMTTSEPTNLPQKFSEPIGRKANSLWAVTNYADVNPLPNVASDYLNGSYVYDGHDARDAGPWSFSTQDEGLPVYAAADGIVDAVQDGNYDREISFGNRPGNYVQLDHGNGFKTLYYHFATNSIVVQVGQKVQVGDLLAHMGSSGISTGTHLHYTPFYRGAAIETGYAPSVYNLEPLPYGGDVKPFVFETGVTNNFISTDMGEHVSNNSSFAIGSTGTVYFWLQVYGLKPNDSIQWTYIRPNGSVLGQNTFTNTNDYHYSWWYWSQNIGTFSSVPGNWTVQFSINGVLRQSKRFTIDSTGTAALRMTDASANIINSDRTTPIPFGTATVGGASIIKSFTIQNHGTTSLLLSNASLPPGYSLLGALPSSISPNGSATLSVRMDALIPGNKFGTVAFNTNDPDCPRFAFNVSGVVTGVVAGGRPSITLTGPAAKYDLQGAPAMFAQGAIISTSSANGFNGGTIKVEVANKPEASDILNVSSRNGGPGRIVVKQRVVYYDQIPIGLTQGGTKGNPLVITLNANATLASISKLVSNLYYESNSSKESYSRKYIRITLTDQAGVVSNLAIAHVIPSGKVGGPQLLNGVGTTTDSKVNDDARVPALVSPAFESFSAAVESVLSELEREKNARSKKEAAAPRSSPMRFLKLGSPISVS